MTGPDPLALLLLETLSILPLFLLLAGYAPRFAPEGLRLDLLCGAGLAGAVMLGSLAFGPGLIYGTALPGLAGAFFGWRAMALTLAAALAMQLGQNAAPLALSPPVISGLMGLLWRALPPPTWRNAHGLILLGIMLCAALIPNIMQAAPGARSLAFPLIGTLILAAIASGWIIRRERQWQNAAAQLHDMLNRDGLTGLATRQKLADKTAQLHRNRRPMALINIALNHFRAVNQEFGHKAGDHVLRRLALMLQAAMPDGAVVARISGAEFAILLTDTDRDEAIAYGSALCQYLTMQPVHLKNGSVSITASVGLAFASAGASFDNLLCNAGQCLNRAKATGPNQFWCSVSPDLSTGPPHTTDSPPTGSAGSQQLH